MFTITSAHDYFEPQYVLRKTLPAFAEHVAEWERLSADEDLARHRVGVERYGDDPRQTMETFKAAPDRVGDGLAIFIHGGFWRAMQREQSRFMAAPFLRCGMDCIITEYRLMPVFRMADLIEDMASALHRIAEIAGPMKLSDRWILAGHSAGAHLALYGTMAAREAGIPLGQISFLLLSGVFDIFPVHATAIADETQMSLDEVARWSVYSGADLGGRPALFVVGGDETDDFKRQSFIGAQLLGRGRDRNIVIVDGANHLTLLTKLAQNDALFDAIMSRL